MHVAHNDGELDKCGVQTMASQRMLLIKLALLTILALLVGLEVMGARW